MSVIVWTVCSFDDFVWETDKISTFAYSCNKSVGWVNKCIQSRLNLRVFLRRLLQLKVWNSNHWGLSGCLSVFLTE